MSAFDSGLPFPAIAARAPKIGDSPAINSVTYPSGTPLSLVQVLGHRFNLYGLKSNDSDNTGDAKIGTTVEQPQLLSPGSANFIELIAGDDSVVDLADYVVTGTNGDGVRWLRVN